MAEIFSREISLIGDEAILKLKGSKVAVFGLGGVGSAAAEALCRGAVGHLSLFDGDRVCESNLNRQLIALNSSIGKLKVDAAAQRYRDINPEIEIECFPVFYTPENAKEFDFKKFDYIIDAVDMVTAKIELAVRAKEAGVPIISCMGTGNKLGTSPFEVCDLFKTSVCPLARVMRRELSKRGIDKLKVVYSKETAIKNAENTVSSISFVPPVAGFMMAGEVIRDLMGGDKK